MAAAVSTMPPPPTSNDGEMRQAIEALAVSVCALLTTHGCYPCVGHAHGH